MRPRARDLTAFAIAIAAVACTELRAAEEAPGGTDPAGAEDAGGAVGPGDPPPGTSPDASTPRTDAGTKAGADAGGPGAACRPLLPDCLDPSAADVIEVPTEMSLAAALTSAKANDTIQIKAGTPSGTVRIPPYVTLRGCGGAKITGFVTFLGSGGVVEGFTVANTGSIVANATGSYVVRRNRFVGPATGNEPGVSGRSIDGIVDAQVSLTVEGNVFEERPYGVEAATRYDTGTRTVTIVARNNVFRGVANPVVISEAGLVGKIDAKVEHSTFHDFGTAIALYGMDRVVKTSGNVFVKGTSAIKGAPYEIAYSFAWDVTTPAGSPPNAGTFATGDPRFVDAATGDFRPGPGSPLVDVVPNGMPLPADDVQGCPRPVGPTGETPRADVGAYENP